MRCTKENEVWKSFHDNPLTHSEAHYLMTILSFEEKKQEVKASDLARALNIAPATVSQAIKNLIKKKWITMDQHKSLSLVAKRRKIVTQIRKNKALLMDFFVSILHLEKTLADKDSCKMEHLLSPEVSEALEDFLHHQRNQNNKQEKASKGLPIISPNKVKKRT